MEEGYLDRARKAFASHDFASTVAEAQLSVENSAKAVISCFRIPSGSHDPSEELLDIMEDNQPKIIQLLGKGFLKHLKDVARKAHILAPEHGRSTYGDIEGRIPPWEIYSEEDARKGLDCAEDAYKVANRFVKTWYAP